MMVSWMVILGVVILLFLLGVVGVAIAASSGSKRRSQGEGQGGGGATTAIVLVLVVLLGIPVVLGLAWMFFGVAYVEYDYEATEMQSLEPVQEAIEEVQEPDVLETEPPDLIEEPESPGRATDGQPAADPLPEPPSGDIEPNGE